MGTTDLAFCCIAEIVPAVDAEPEIYKFLKDEIKNISVENSKKWHWESPEAAAATVGVAATVATGTVPEFWPELFPELEEPPELEPESRVG